MRFFLNVVKIEGNDYLVLLNSNNWRLESATMFKEGKGYYTDTRVLLKSNKLEEENGVFMVSEFNDVEEEYNKLEMLRKASEEVIETENLEKARLLAKKYIGRSLGL